MQNEATLRLAVFVGLFVVLAVIERFAPRRTRPELCQTLVTNWLFVIVDTVTLRALALFLPFAAVLAAADASTRGWGLLNMTRSAQMVGVDHRGIAVGSCHMAATCAQP